MKKILVLVLTIITISALAVPVFAASTTIYLKGSGSSFSASGWQNIFYLDDSLNDNDPSVWHLVYSGNEPGKITSMQITFTNGKVFNWDPSQGFSTNKGNNNPGWVIVAPYNWKIDYIDKGNNNESGSFLVTSEGGNPQFNISGYHKGTPNPQPEYVRGLFSIKACIKQKMITETHKPIYKMHKYGTLVSQANPERKNDLPEGFTGAFLNNGMPYIKINLSALKRLGEVKIGIAESNKPGNKQSSAWNTPIAPGQPGTGKDKAMTYTLKVIIVNGKEKLQVKSDLPGFGVQVYPGTIDVKNIKGPADIKHNGAEEYDIPALDKNGCFYFFFHIGSANYEGTEVIGCERPGAVETKTKVFKPGEIKMVVTGPEVAYNGDYTTKSFKTPEAVKGAGAEFTYEVKMYAPAKGANPVLLLSEEITVIADGGSAQIFNFGTKILPPIVTVVCGYAKCPGPVN